MQVSRQQAWESSEAINTAFHVYHISMHKKPTLNYEDEVRLVHIFDKRVRKQG